MNALKKTVQFGLPSLCTWIQCAAWGRLVKCLAPNAGTLIILCLFLLTQSVSAEPALVPQAQQGAATLLSYQGTLTNKSGASINGSVEMVFTLYHQAESGTPFWTEAYTGAQKIVVTDGQFHVLLGSRTALNPADLTGDLYLGITVNGEVMSPREQLTSVPNAVNAERSQGRFYVGEVLSVGTSGVGEGGEIWLQNGTGGNGWAVDNFYGTLRAHHDGVSYLELGSSGTLNVNGNGSFAGNVSAGNVYAGSISVGNVYGHGTQQIHMPGGVNSGNIYLNWHSGRGLYLGGGTESVKFGVDENGNVTCGGLVEANLQPEEDRNAERIDRFSEGDVLCWADDQLEKCSAANNPLVQAVADANGKPIVIGAEVIRVLGPVHTGDLLVASDTPGYAMVNNDPRPGAVIAQALEDFDGKQGLMKAMIRKF